MQNGTWTENIYENTRIPRISWCEFHYIAHAKHGCTGRWLILCLRQHTLGKINSLAPGKFERNFRHVIFKQILVIDGWGVSCEIAQIWMSLDFTDDQSTLVQVMAWCRQATSHYLSQCWPRFLSPYGVTRPQWVNSLTPGRWVILAINWWLWYLLWNCPQMNITGPYWW